MAKQLSEGSGRGHPPQPWEERAASLEKHWEDAIHSLKGAPNVVDIRNFGLMGAIELALVFGALSLRVGGYRRLRSEAAR